MYSLIVSAARQLVVILPVAYLFALPFWSFHGMVGHPDRGISIGDSFHTAAQADLPQDHQTASGLMSDPNRKKRFP